MHGRRSQAREGGSVSIDKRELGKRQTDRTLLSEHIKAVLTDEIATGQLPPGTTMDEAQLGKRFKASRTPVREGLRQLGDGAG